MSLRILVVEDEMTIAFHIEDMLVALGHEVVELAMRLPRAIELAKTAAIDLAILDINLAGQVSFPVADILSARGVPYIFATGYGTAGLDPAYAGAVVLTKPFMQSHLERAIQAAA